MLVVILLVVFIVGAFSYPTVKEKFVEKEPEIVEFEYQNVLATMQNQHFKFEWAQPIKEGFTYNYNGVERYRI